MRNRNIVETNTAQQQRSPTQQPYVVTHDFGGTAELTTTLAHALSDVTGIDVTDTGFTLNDYVDPEALDALFQPKSDGTPRTNGSVQMTILGCRVVIHSTGQIVITPPQQTA
jgi:hypothetical protein